MTLTLPALNEVGVAAAVDRLVAAADLASVTYYPLTSDFGVRAPTDAQADIDRVVARFPNRPIYFQEIGYPTSATLGGSDDKQREFAAQVFTAWDRHASRIKYVGWLWLTDLSPQATADLVSYYGVGGTIAVRFGEYLRTLGIKNHDGTPKPAYTALTELLEARGW